MFKNIFLISAFIWHCGAATAQDTAIKSAITKAAQDKLSTYLSYIPEGAEKNYGFDSRSEMSAAVAGTPYRTISFSKEFYTDKATGDKNYIVLQNEWRVPVSVGGTDRILLTAVQEGGTTDITDMGGSVLAKELQENNKAKTAGYILRVYPFTADFLVISASDSDFTAAGFIPLTSARMAFPSLDQNAKSTPLSLNEVMALIREKQTGNR